MERAASPRGRIMSGPGCRQVSLGQSPCDFPRLVLSYAVVPTPRVAGPAQQGGCPVNHELEAIGMDYSRQIRLVSTDGQRVAYSPATLTMAQPEHERLAAPLRRAISRTRQWLLGEQQSDGHWCAELEGDTILESEYILLLAFLGKHDGEIALKCARYILTKQNADGGWSTTTPRRAEIPVRTARARHALPVTRRTVEKTVEIWSLGHERGPPR